MMQTRNSSGNNNCPCECEAYPDCATSSRIGYAFVPFQTLCKVYKPAKALREGTIFPELNLTIDTYERGLWNGK